MPNLHFMNNRLISIDVFRGMTIFFMIIVNTPGSWEHVYAPLLHAKWHGCSPTDLVFPFFMYIVGVSMYYSYSKFEVMNSDALRKGIIRGLKIIGIGLLLNWYPFYNKNIDVLRIFGVLQRIGLAYLCAIIVLYATNRKWIEWKALGLLIFYAIVIYIFGNNDYSLESNMVKDIDLAIFGENHIYKGFGIPFDPEGLLSTIPSVATILIGFICGKYIDYQADSKKLTSLAVSGVGLITIGFVLDKMGIPINKPLWTSSYVLYTAGFASLTWAMMIWIIDFQKIKVGTYFLTVFGKNPIVAFVLSGVIIKTFGLFIWKDKGLYGHIYTDFFQRFLGNQGGSFAQAICYMLLIWFIVYQLDKKDIIVKV